MAELSIIPVNTAEDLDRFVELPWSIYTPDSLWVPNLKKQDRELLSPGEHPFWKTARRELFLALRAGRPGEAGLRRSEARALVEAHLLDGREGEQLGLELVVEHLVELLFAHV